MNKSKKPNKTQSSFILASRRGNCNEIFKQRFNEQSEKLLNSGQLSNWKIFVISAIVPTVLIAVLVTGYRMRLLLWK